MCHYYWKLEGLESWTSASIEEVSITVEQNDLGYGMGNPAGETSSMKDVSIRTEMTKGIEWGTQQERRQA